MTRVPKGMVIGAIVGLVLTAVYGALYCGFRRTYLMTPAPDFMSGARFGAFFFVLVAGLPPAVMGVMIGGAVAAITGHPRFRWTNGRGACLIALAALVVILLAALVWQQVFSESVGPRT